ncbi:hypothetical protein [Pseudorhodoferax sp.]
MRRQPDERERRGMGKASTNVTLHKARWPIGATVSLAGGPTIH